MTPVNGPENRSWAFEILKQLPLAEKTAVWGTLGTIRPHLSFEVEKDVQSLLGAVSSEGVAYRTIIDLLTNRRNDQRQEIADEFLDFTKQDLLKTLVAAMSGNLEDIVIGLLRPAPQLDAHEIKTALKGPEADTLVEILSTRTSPRLREILDFYKQDFQSDLEKDIVSQTGGSLQDLLLTLIQGKRERYSGIIDYVLIEHDAKALVDAGSSDRDGLDERKWIRILAQRSAEHLNRVFTRYHKMTGLPIEEGIVKHFQGTAREAVLTLASVLRNTPLYFATKLFQAVKDPGGPNRRTLSRIMVSRSETDLLSIRTEFKKHYGMSLYSFIRAEMKGDYQAVLLGLCRAEDL